MSAPTLARWRAHRIRVVNLLSKSRSLNPSAAPWLTWRRLDWYKNYQ
jgi:hypothetical protein